MSRPTDKQIEYANIIAEALDISLPEFSFEEYLKFLSTHIPEYKRQRSMACYESIRNNKDFADRFDVDWIIKVLDEICGLYAFISSGQVVYIGKSKNLANRIPASFAERSRSVWIDDIYYLKTPNLADAHILEILLITEYSPILNRDCKTSERSTMFESGLDILRDFSKILKVNRGNL